MIILSLLLCTIWNYHGTLIFSQTLNLFLSDIIEYNYFASDITIHKFRFLIIINFGFCYPNHATTEVWSTIGGKNDWGEGDHESDKITWLQVFLGNALLYPVSVSNCPGPERVVFCISIVDIIPRSTLVVFSMLRAINYYYYRGPVCNVLPFYSHYYYIELSILFLFPLLKDTSA